MARLELIVDPAKAKQGFREADQASDRYRRGARQATDQTNKVRGSFQRLASQAGSLKGALAGIGIGAVVAQTTRLVTQSIAATAAISEQADVAGIGAERFQELTKSFSDLGGVAEGVTSGALRRFNRRFGLAQEGMGAANKTLERLNINLSQGTGPALEEAIRKLADMENNANRTAEASQLFGEDAGPRLAAVLAQGSNAIDSQIAKLREQGRVLGDDLVEDARAANDALGEISDTLDADFNRRIAENASTITDLAEAYSFAADKGLDFVGFLTNRAQDIGTAAGVLTQGEFGVARVLNDLDEVNTQIELLTGQAARLQNQLKQTDEGTRAYDRLKAELDETRQAIDEARVRQQLLNDQYDLFTASVESNNNAVNENAFSLKELNAQLEFLEGFSASASGELTDLQEAFGGSAEEAKALNKEARELVGLQSDFDRMFGRFLESRAESDVTSMSGAFGNLGSEEQNRSLDDTSDIMRRIDRQMESMNKTGRDLGLTFQSAFEDAIIEGEKFSDVLSGVLKDISRIILRTNVTEPASKAIANFDWSSLLTNDSSMGTGTGSSPAIATSADGNVFTGPSMTTVSERGHPEAVLPLERHGGKLGVRASGGGGGDVTVNIINEGGERLQSSGQRERRGPNGERQIDVMVKSSIQRLDAQGELDGTFRRHGANRQGQF